MNAARQFTYLMAEEKYFLRTLLYFDIFNYPLTAEEIIQYLPVLANLSADTVLSNLRSQKILFRFRNFYSLKNDPEMAVKRLQGNALAEKRMKEANRFSRLVYSFPFVRAVMLSGSISKGYMDEASDIDYFIITEPNRLWLVRTALAIFRRVFLFNSGKNLCTNYFIDTQNLEINEKNIFTAIELSTLQPMFGHSEITKFQSANPWVLSFLPNIRYKNGGIRDTKPFLKAAIERILSYRLFDLVDLWLMNRTTTYLKRRYAHELVSAHDFEIAFRSTPGVSKSHPRFFQKKVLIRYAKKIMDFEMQHGIDLSL
jgi:hypothetical protein